MALSSTCARTTAKIALFYDLYLDNILSNGVLLTEDNYLENGYISDKVTGGYNMEKYLHINTRTDEE